MCPHHSIWMYEDDKISDSVYRWKWSKRFHYLKFSILQRAQRDHLQNDWHHCILPGLVHLCSRKFHWTVNSTHWNVFHPYQSQKMKMAKSKKKTRTWQFSSILGLRDPILPRLCRSRTLYFEIPKELSQHIWSHTGKFSIECCKRVCNCCHRDIIVLHVVNHS